jgi:alpha-1,6-mannosyltransferase
MEKVSLAPYDRITWARLKIPGTILPFLILGTVVEALWILVRGQLRQLEPTVETITLFLAISILYLISGFLSAKLLDRADSARLSIFITLGFALVFRLTLANTMPVWSEDLYRYRFEGELIQAGENPYLLSAENVGAKDLPRIPSAHLPAGYGPLTEWCQALIARYFSDLRAFKLVGIAGDLWCLALMLWYFPKIGLPRQQLIFYAWHPLPIFEFWGSGHNDSLAVAGLLWFLLGLTSSSTAARTSFLSSIALGIGIASKWWPALLIPLAWARLPRWQLHHLFLAALPTVLLLVPFGLDSLTNFKFFSGYAGGWRNGDFLHSPIALIFAENAKVISILLVASGSVMAAKFQKDPFRAALTVIAFTLAVTSSLHAWYLTWLIPILAVRLSISLLLWTCLAPILYQPVFAWHHLRVWNGVFSERWLVHLPPALWFLCECLNAFYLKRKALPMTR